MTTFITTITGGRLHVQEHHTSLDGLHFTHRRIEHPTSHATPVLFVSGAFQTMDSWARFARTFAPHTTVLLVDPPGMGRSDLLPPDRGVEFLAECLEQVLDEQRVERVSVIAASYGTPSALRLAADRPERIDRIILAGTMKLLPVHLRDRIAFTAELARSGDREGLARECVNGMLCLDPSKEIDRRESSARVLRSGILRMSDAELLKYAANTERLLNHRPIEVSSPIAGPEALVFTGEHDVFTYPAACREVAAAFERAWFTTVRRADHLFHLQQWDAVIGLLMGFTFRALPDGESNGWYRLDAAGPARERNPVVPLGTELVNDLASREARPLEL